MKKPTSFYFLTSSAINSRTDYLYNNTTTQITGPPLRKLGVLIDTKLLLLPTLSL